MTTLTAHYKSGQVQIWVFPKDLPMIEVARWISTLGPVSKIKVGG